MDTMMDATTNGPRTDAPEPAPAHPAAAAAEPSLLGRLLKRDTAAPTRAERLEGVAIGRLEAIGEAGECIVSIPVLNIDRRAALSTVALNATDVGRPLALGFEAGDARRPIILGRLLGAEAAASSTPVRPDAPVVPPAVLPEGVDVRVEDGRLILSAEQAIELRSGEAAIELSADGRITQRGTYITSQASATQRILGGSVNVN